MRFKQKTFSKLDLVSFFTKSEASRRFQPAIYIVFREEAGSEVQNIQILQENLNFDFKIRFFFLLPNQRVTKT